jgi:hypothetical protein
LGKADTSRLDEERAALRFCPMRKALYLAGLSARQGSAASPCQLAWWLPQDANHHTLKPVRYELSRREMDAGKVPSPPWPSSCPWFPRPRRPGPSISNCGGDARCESSYLSAVLRAHFSPQRGFLCPYHSSLLPVWLPFSLPSVVHVLLVAWGATFFVLYTLIQIPPVTSWRPLQSCSLNPCLHDTPQSSGLSPGEEGQCCFPLYVLSCCWAWEVHAIQKLSHHNTIPSPTITGDQIPLPSFTHHSRLHPTLHFSSKMVKSTLFPQHSRNQRPTSTSSCLPNRTRMRSVRRHYQPCC